MIDNHSPTRLPPFSPDYRASGVLLHVTSLPSPYGIGDVGPAALAWIDRLREAGQSWWQALPLGPTGYGNSPYQSLSSFAGNGCSISPDWLDRGWTVAERATVRARSFPPGSNRLRGRHSFQTSIARKRLGRLRAGARADLRPALRAVLQRSGALAGGLCAVPGAEGQATTARITSNGRQSWSGATRQRYGSGPGADLRTRSAVCASPSSCCSARGSASRQHARSKGVRLIGDLPFFVSPDSSDVWATPGILPAGRAASAALRCRGASRLLQRAGTALGQSRLQLGGPPRDRLSLVHRPFALRCWLTST